MSQVTFVHFDPSSGKILSVTSEHADHYAARLGSGEEMLRVDRPVDIWTNRVNVNTREIEALPTPPPPPASVAISQAIGRELARTDRYFVADALDNIDAPTQASWRNYRKALRAAAKKTTADEMLAIIPADPKGTDAFAGLRKTKG